LTFVIVFWTFRSTPKLQFPKWKLPWKCEGLFPHTLFTPGSMWHDSQASLLAHNLTTSCLGHEPKAKVTTHGIAIGESSSRLCICSRGPPLSYLICFLWLDGVCELDVPFVVHLLRWFFLSSSMLVLPFCSFLFIVFLGCFGLFMIGWVSSTRKLFLSQVTNWTWTRHSKALKKAPQKRNIRWQCVRWLFHIFSSYKVFYCCLKTGTLQLIKELMILMRVRKTP